MAGVLAGHFLYVAFWLVSTLLVSSFLRLGAERAVFGFRALLAEWRLNKFALEFRAKPFGAKVEYPGPTETMREAVGRAVMIAVVSIAPFAIAALLDGEGANRFTQAARATIDMLIAPANAGVILQKAMAELRAAPFHGAFVATLGFVATISGLAGIPTALFMLRLDFSETSKKILILSPIMLWLYALLLVFQGLVSALTAGPFTPI